MNKRFLVLSICILFSSTIFSQREKVNYLPDFDKKLYHFGFYLGLNQNDFKIDLRPSPFLADIRVKPTTGFNVGLIADLRLHKNINLRFEPGLISNSKTITFNHLSGARDSVREIGSTYLHLPLVFKFSTNRYNNIRPYLLAGISYDYNFSSNQKNPDDNFSGSFRMKTSNFMYELGVGVDFYLYFFKFSPSIRGVFALNNEIVNDNPSNGPSPWTAPVNFLGTRGIFINFAFE
ncbi:MAG: PorT family protein [Flavobacteriaceae bacterium]